MRAVIQRARSASVSVDDEVIGRIGRGLVVLLGVGIGLLTDWGWGVVWAVVLIAMGVAILFGGLGRGRR